MLNKIKHSKIQLTHMVLGLQEIGNTSEFSTVKDQLSIIKQLNILCENKEQWMLYKMVEDLIEINSDAIEAQENLILTIIALAIQNGDLNNVEGTLSDPSLMTTETEKRMEVH